MIKIALAGNPNCGKTMLFNALTGSNQYVGNWAGVTVEAKEGKLRGADDVVIADLPGIYSLSPYTPEEVVARNYLVNEEPDIILNIIDGTNLERNLYLTTQLCEIGIPVVMAIHMIDVVKKNGDFINLEEISEHFGCVCFEISALKGTGIKKCIDKTVSMARTNTGIPPVHHSFDDRVESAIHLISAMLPEGTDMVHKRYFATKIFERDELVAKDFPDFDSVIADVEKVYGDSSDGIIADQRYKYITNCIDECRTKSGAETATEKIDKIVTNKYLSLPIFALIMFGVYYISVTTVGGWLSELITENIFSDNGLPLIAADFLASINCAPWLSSLIVDGIIGGVGAVLSFVPQIFVLFVFLSFLEDCGYMSRIAFIMDKLFRKFGLSGKSFIPILVGTGCGVPGIMASRTIESEKERRMTIITTTFIPCGAKLPVIALIAAAFFGKAWWVAPSAYFVGIFAIISSGIMLKKTKLFRGEPAPFVMELPSYHMPTAKSVFRATWDRTVSYIKKAGTIILLASIAVWFLSNFGFYGGRFGMVQAMDNSILAYVGSLIQNIFKPLGFGTWQASVATILGLMAKEEIVGVFGVLYSDFSTAFTPLEGYSFLIFNLLCAPCVAAMGAIRREMNSAKWTAFAIFYQCFFAYCTSFCLYQIANCFITGSFTALTAISILLAAVFVFMLVKKPKKS